MRKLALLDDEHRIEMFDFKTRPMHFNAFGMEGEPLRDADPTQIRADSNVYPITPSMANLNLNSHLPRNIAFVTAVLSEIAQRH